MRATASGDQSGTSTAYVLDLATGGAAQVPDSSPWYQYSRVAWRTDADAIVYETTGGQLGVYQPGNRGQRTFRSQCCAIAIVTATVPAQEATDASVKVGGALRRPLQLPKVAHGGGAQ